MNRSASLFEFPVMEMDVSFVKNSTLGLDSGYNGTDPSGTVPLSDQDSVRRMSAISAIGGSIATGAVGMKDFSLKKE